jgi:hypothetical protein
VSFRGSFLGIQKDKLSEDQKKEVERLRQFATRNRFELQMNSTRWRIAIDSVLAIEGYSLGYRVKCITDKQDPGNPWQMDFPQGLPLYNAIEWLEVECVLSTSASREMRLALPTTLQKLGQTLEAARVPFTVLPKGVRIQGYTRT